MRSARAAQQPIRHALSRRTNAQQQQQNGSWLRLAVCFSLFSVLCAYTYLLTTTIHHTHIADEPGVSSSSLTSEKAATPADLVAKQQQQYHLPVVHDNNEKVLALLYPPGLMGGYRNQVIRLLSFCVYAMKNKLEKLLLPSILWATEIELEDTDGSRKEHFLPIPHDLLFDVEFWNEQENDLPKFVDYNEVDGSALPCWSFPKAKELEEAKKPAEELTVEVLKRGFLTPIANFSRAVATRDTVINPRRVDKLSEVHEGCGGNRNNPVAYGGGIAAGRLWNQYTQMQQSGGGIPFQADAKLLQSLRPKREWRELSMSCVKQHTTGKGNGGNDSSPSYVALHARMELEMMVHACGASMEKNLTKVFGMLEDLVQTELKAETDVNPTGLFIAVNRGGMEVFEGGGYMKHKANIDENIATLNKAVKDGGGLLHNRLHVFECGRLLTGQYYEANPHATNLGGLLDSVVNFYIATEALAFVGVRGSSYSTDIWTTRFHQGKGRMNFEYTPEGIKRIPNGGLPPPHHNCKRPRKN